MQLKDIANKIEELMKEAEKSATKHGEDHQCAFELGYLSEGLRQIIRDIKEELK